MAGAINFSVIRGDTFTKSVTFRNKATKVPVDLTGATVSGTVKLKDGTSVALACALTNPSAGQFSFSLSSVATADIPAAVHQIEVQVEYLDNTIQTLISGNLVVKEQIAP